MPMYWYNSGTWRETTDLSVWNGSTWKQVLQCWIWDGIAWKLTHTAPTILQNVVVSDYPLCDPTNGSFRVTWSYTSANIDDWYLRIEYSFNGGASYATYLSFIDPTSSPFDGTLDGVGGFTSLDNTYFRISLISSADDTTNSIDSPQVRTPPFPC